MTKLYRAALEVHHFCERNGWRFCIIGGVAVQRWGEVRVTTDVDLTVFTGFGEEERFAERWLEKFSLRPPATVEFAVRNRVLLLLNRRGTRVDVALGAFEFEGRAIERSSLWRLPGGKSLRTCSAEDLMVHKCFANRDQDWVDVDGILARQHGKLDLDLVRAELRPLVALKEQPEILDKLERRIAHHDQPFTKIKPTRRRS